MSEPAATPPEYSAAPPPPSSAPAERPGRTMGIVAFVLSFFIQLVALILGIIALVQSRKAGQKNGFALAAIIISAVGIVLGIIAIIMLIAFGSVLFGQYAEWCSQYGSGTHTIEGVEVTLVCD